MDPRAHWPCALFSTKPHRSGSLSLSPEKETRERATDMGTKQGLGSTGHGGTEDLVISPPAARYLNAYVVSRFTKHPHRTADTLGHRVRREW